MEVSQFFYSNSFAKLIFFELFQDDLPKMLRSYAQPCYQLQKEEVRTHQQPPPQEEAEVNFFFVFSSFIYKLRIINIMRRRSLPNQLQVSCIVTLAGQNVHSLIICIYEFIVKFLSHNIELVRFSGNLQHKCTLIYGQ